MDEFELSLGEMAERVGRSKPSVSNRLRLLELPDDVLAMLERGELTEGHARAVLAVPDHEGRRRLAREIVQKGLSVRAAERAARWAGANAQAAEAPPGRPGARRPGAEGRSSADRDPGRGSRPAGSRSRSRTSTSSRSSPRRSSAAAKHAARRG